MSVGGVVSGDREGFGSGGTGHTFYNTVKESEKETGRQEDNVGTSRQEPR